MGTCVFTGGGEGGGGRALNNVLYGKASPLSLTPYPLIHIFLQKSYAFRNPDIKNGTVVTCFHKNTASLFYSLVMKLKMIMSPFPL